METRLKKANPGLQKANPELQKVNPGLQKANPGLKNVDSAFKKRLTGLQKANPELQKANPGLKNVDTLFKKQLSGLQKAHNKNKEEEMPEKSRYPGQDFSHKDYLAWLRRVYTWLLTQVGEAGLWVMAAEHVTIEEGEVINHRLDLSPGDHTMRFTPLNAAMEPGMPVEVEFTVVAE